MATGAPTSIRALVNFQKDRESAGQFAQWDRDLRVLKLAPVEAEIVDIRSMAKAPTLDEQGFALVEQSVEGDWADKAFLEGAFVDSCLDLVKRLTGAKATINMYFPIVRTRSDTEGTSDPAHFIHLDQTREAYVAQCVDKAKEYGHELKRGAIYNVWKATTPPPQDQPLVLYDRRDIDTNDYVIGMSVASGDDEGVPYIGLAVPEKVPTLYYVPDIGIDESLVFLSADFDPDHPLGCAHTAIEPSDPEGKLVPRESVELRVLALFD